MPSVLAGIPDEVDELIEDLVDRDIYESRSEAACALLEYAAVNKHNIDL